MELLARYPQLGGRVVARGDLDAEELSAHLQVCDVLLQPYPDGASTRRTSLMAALAHGAPTVTTLGLLSEPTWAEADCAAFVPAADCQAMIRSTETLLTDAAVRFRLSTRAREVYRKHFALENTIQELLRP
jgi:glycosyltransferase involved in cell wall biosynthesis